MAQVAETISTVTPSARAVRISLVGASIALAVGMLVLALAVPMIRGQVFVADDLAAFHIPARAFYADALTHGERFDWWPQLFNGFYLTGEGQVGAYHPLHLALYRFLPLGVALNLELILSYFWMFLGGFYWLRRRLGRNDAAAFGAMLMTFCGFTLLHLPHLNAIAVIAHIPWLLWAIDVIVCDRRRGSRRLAIAAFPLLTASQLLLGYPQYVWYSLLVELAYTCWLLHVRRSPRESEGSLPSAVRSTPRPIHSPRLSAGRVWLTLALGLALGGMIGAVQLLPTFDALSNSARHETARAFADWGSLHPWNFLQLVGPYLFEDRVVGLNTHELGLYSGCVPLVLCAWLWIRRRELGRLRPLVIAASWLALIALWMAAGQYGYLYRVQTWLPVVGKFRFPCRAIVLFQMALAVLSAVALVQLVTPHPCRPRLSCRQFAPLSALIVLSILVASGAALLWPEHLAQWPLVVAGPLLMAFAAWIVWLADRYNRWAAAALVLFSAADIGVYGLSYAMHGKTAELADVAASTPAPPQGTDRRLLVELPVFDDHAARVGNRALLSGWSRLGGYAGLEPATRLDYRQPSTLRVAGVGWVTRTPETSTIAGVTPYSESLLRVTGVLPAQRLVTRVVASSDPATDLGKIDPATTTLLDPADAAQIKIAPATPGRVEQLAKGPGRYSLQTRCDAPQLLVLDERWHRGWQATVNGRPERVWRVNGDFFGLVVPAGESRIEMAFHPASLREGGRLSMAGLGIWFIALIWGWRGRPAHTRESKS